MHDVRLFTSNNLKHAHKAQNGCTNKLLVGHALSGGVESRAHNALALLCPELEEEDALQTARYIS